MNTITEYDTVKRRYYNYTKIDQQILGFDVLSVISNPFQPRSGFSTAPVITKNGENYISSDYLNKVLQGKNLPNVFNQPQKPVLVKPAKTRRKVIPLAEVARNFSMKPDGKGGYVIKNLKTKEVVYKNEICANRSGKITIDHVPYDIRGVVNCLRDQCDYQRNNTDIYPRIDKSATEFKFSVNDVKCYRSDGTEWKDAPKSKNETSEPKKTPTLQQTELRLDAIIDDVKESTPEYECSILIAYTKDGKPIIEYNGVKNEKDKNALLALMSKI